jgi:hypothetical protein
MSDDWYNELDLVRLRHDMLRAHQAWKQAAPGKALETSGLDATRQRLMLEVRQTVDAYMARRDVYRQKGGPQARSA